MQLRLDNLEKKKIWLYVPVLTSFDEIISVYRKKYNNFLK